jgi:hypothetical protein
MAIAYDAVGQGSGFSSYTYSHTCSGADRYLVVTTTASSSGNASAVSYAGVSMTLLTSRNGGYHQIWGLPAPATGANNVSITQGSYSGQSVSLSYNGVSSVGTPEASNGANSGGPTTSITSSVTTITDNAFVVASSMYETASNTQNASTGSTERVKRSGNASSGYAIGLFDNGPKTPAGSVSMTVTASASSGIMDMYQIVLKPSVLTLGASILASLA